MRLADVQELEELAFSLEVNERYQIDSMEDYDHVIDELEHSGSGDVERVRAARSFCSRKGILPQQGSTPHLLARLIQDIHILVEEPRNGSNETSRERGRAPEDAEGGKISMKLKLLYDTLRIEVFDTNEMAEKKALGGQEPADELRTAHGSD